MESHMNITSNQTTCSYFHKNPFGTCNIESLQTVTNLVPLKNVFVFTDIYSKSRLVLSVANPGGD